MKTTEILCITLSLLTNLNPAPADQEKKHVQLYHAEDDVQILDIDNFKTQVENKSHAWLVEFYMGWCGNCQRFAPSWKALATDIFNWKDLVQVGAVACSDEINSPLCREYEIVHYPAVKYFHENYQTIPQDLGVFVHNITEGISSLRHHVIDRIVTEINEGRGVMYPNLLPYTHSDVSRLFDSVPSTIQYIFLVVQAPQSYLGAEVALDLHKTLGIAIRYAFNNHSGLVNNLPIDKFPGVVVLDRNNSIHVLPGVINDIKQLKSAIAIFLSDKGIKIFEEIPSKTKNPTNKPTPDPKQKARTLLKQRIQKMGDVVFQMDLESAVRYSLKLEIANIKIIQDEQLKALVAYLGVVEKYFPFGHNASSFLKELIDFTHNVGQIEGWKIGEIVKRAEENRVFSSPQRFLACEGSLSRYRGYPCSLWKLFHYLTVNAVQEENPKEILDVMHGYVKFFFACAVCSQHFQEMAARRNMSDVASLDSAILWLWEAHNEVNERLAGDLTEDPEFPKRQFPTNEACPRCVNLDNSWNSEEVLKYLKNMYGSFNVRYIGSDTKVLFPGLE
ncbi:Evr1 Alr and/or Thioredoxin domain containing protein [Asbolus verrucosus]|uniref:Sulfhydryl oxidase n=1 Tax=Asbolus verrucosus TaxID=1661398 RepID=A0A482VMF6_ASBVE|nr:Evr1 Alr and/or Thioredoxin domain containing protein [Asbolus verrucosus]